MMNSNTSDHVKNSFDYNFSLFLQYQTAMPRGIPKKAAQKKAEEAEAEAKRLKAIAEQLTARAAISKAKKELQDAGLESSNEDEAIGAQKGTKNIFITYISSTFSRVL